MFFKQLPIKILIFATVICCTLYSCTSKHSSASENISHISPITPKPIPTTLDTMDMLIWNEMDINKLSFKQLVDSFGKPVKFNTDIPRAPSIPDSLAEYLQKFYPDKHLLVYHWYHLMNTDVWLTVYVLPKEDQLQPVFGFAQNSYWTTYE